MNTIQIEKKENYAILQLNRGKVNAINHEMVIEIREAFQDFNKSDSIKGVIVTGIPNFFSAGLDVIELFSYDRNQIDQFFADFGGMFLDMVTFQKPLIAAITGYSPAGGCVIAVACDYRVMAEGDKYTIGLNEVAVNIQISQNLVDAYSFWVGSAKAHELILSGKLLKVQEAKSVGLVDEIVKLEEVINRAEKKMQQYLSADYEILINTKQKLRKHWLEKLDTSPNGDLQQTAQLWWKPEIRAKMEAFVNSLQRK